MRRAWPLAALLLGGSGAASGCADDPAPAAEDATAADVSGDTRDAAASTRVVTYEISLTVDLGPDAPAGAHLSPALAVGSAAEAPFWALGAPASSALVPLVTHGASDTLARSLPPGCIAAHGPGIPARSGVSLFTVDLRPDCPTLTLAAMIGPSPDWFVGVSALPLHDGSAWVEALEVPVRVYDGGVEEGDALGASLGPTVPAAPIADRGQEVGALRLRKLTSRCSELSDPPPPGAEISGVTVTAGDPNVLRPVVTFGTNAEATGVVLFWAEGDTVARIAEGAAVGTHHVIALAGLRPNTPYLARPAAWEGETLVTAAPTPFTTPPLPEGVGTYALELKLGDVIDSFYRNVAHRGFTLVDDVGPEGAGHLLIVDEDARVVWYEPVAVAPGTWPGFDWAPERALLLGAGEQLRRLGPAGAPLGEVPSALPLHTQVLADGPERTLALARERREVDLSRGGATSVLEGDAVVVLGPDGEVQWRWSTFDALEPAAAPYTQPQADGSLRWLDASALSRDSAGDLLVALRLADQVLKVDHVTGALLWRLGGAGSDFQLAPDAEFQRPSDVADLGEGRLLVFDAGQAERGSSRVVELSVDEAAHTASAAWEFALPAPGAGSALRLGNGNTLIASDPVASLIEVTRLGEVVWRARGAGGGPHRALPVRLDACDPVPVPEAP